MSVYRKDYIVYGYKLPYDIKNGNGESVDLWDGKFLPMIEGHPGEEFTLIIDGMCGKYVVFGLLLKSSDDETGWNFEDLHFQNLDKNMVVKRFIELFEIEPPQKPTMFIFSHYS